MNSLVLYSNGTRENLKISFVIPTYKNTKYLFDAVDSIIMQNLTDVNYEIIVVNNDPTTDMSEVIEKYKDSNISIYRNEINYGQVNNINQGILLANGEYVSLLHDDDVLLENYWKVVSEYIYSDKKYPCLIPSYYEFDREYRLDLIHRILRMAFFYRYLYRPLIQLILPNDDLYSLHDVFNAPTCGTLFLRKTLIECGLFEDKYGAAWDRYNYRKLVNSFDMYLIHTYIGGKRTYTGMSNNEKVRKEFREYSDVMKAECGDDKRLRKRADYLYVDKMTIGYIWTRIKSEAFMYAHNLDGFKSISYGKFKRLKDKFTI